MLLTLLLIIGALLLDFAVIAVVLWAILFLLGLAGVSLLFGRGR